MVNGLRTAALTGVRFVLLLGTVLVPQAVAAAADEAFPVVDGKTEAVIVTGGLYKQARLAWRYSGDYNPRALPTAVIDHAAQLQSSIEQSTGRKLRIVPEDEYEPEEGLPAIYLGATQRAQALFGDRLKEIDSDGYIVHVTPSVVVLAGNMDYALYDFMSTYLGIDQYIPVELFTIVPRHERVTVPVETRVEVPAFFSRAFSRINGRTVRLKTPPWRLHSGNGRYAFHHYIGEHFMLADEFPDHPEYFGMWNGKRIPCTGSSTPNPCVLNPAVIDIVTTHCQELLDKQPDRLSVSLAMNDSYRYCQCELCKPLQGPGHSISVDGKTTHASDYWYSFINQVAQTIGLTHPGRYIGTLAYGRAENPPTFPVARNVLPYICDNSADWGNPEERKHDLANIDAWLERVDRIGLYEYLYGATFFIPRLYTRHLADKLRHVAEECPGSGFYAEIYSSHGFDGPKAWITERLLWEPTQDIDRLMTRWCEGCFGPAAAPMKAYFNTLELDLSRGAARAKPAGNLWGYRHEDQYDLYSPDDFPPLWELLEEARTKAEGDSLILKRIDYFASCLKITDVLVRRHHAHAEAAALVETQASPHDVLASLLQNERDWPRFELWRYIQELQAEDYVRTGQGPESSRATQAMEYVLDDSAWQAVGELVAEGNRSPAALRAASKAALEELVRHDHADDSAAAKRLEQLVDLSQRIASAKCAETAPVIDGNTDEACWTWNGQTNWFMRNSAMPFPYVTDFAFAYDDENLYLALRCGDQDRESYDFYYEQRGEKAAQYGFQTKDTPSVHVYLDLAGGPEADSGEMAGYQVVPNVYGGLWEKYKAVEAYKTVWDPDENEWQTEMAIRWDRLNVDPAASACFRLNVVRYMRKQWHRRTGGWYLSHEWVRAHDAQEGERGWLVLE